MDIPRFRLSFCFVTLVASLLLSGRVLAQNTGKMALPEPGLYLFGSVYGIDLDLERSDQRLEFRISMGNQSVAPENEPHKHWFDDYSGSTSWRYHLMPCFVDECGHPFEEMEWKCLVDRIPPSPCA